MSLILSGTNGVSDVDGTAATPAIRGTDTNTGIFFPAADTIAFSEGGVESMRLDASGNLGLGVTPSAWDTLKGFDIGSGGAVWGTAAQVGVASNAYYGAGGFRYKATNVAAALQVDGNIFKFFTAPSGTAGNAISFTQAMTLDASGNLLLGQTSSTDSSFRLQMTGAGGSIHAAMGTNANALRFSNVNTANVEWAIGTSSPGVANAGNFFSFTQLSGGSWNERARIDSLGQLLIGGTANNGFVLDVQRTASGTVELIRASNNIDQTFRVRATQGTGILIGNGNTGALIFDTSNTERARIDSSGNLLVNRTANTSTTSQVALSYNANAGIRGLGIQATVQDIGTAVQFINASGTVCGTISQGTSSVAYNTSSDYRLKKDVQPMTGALDRVAALKPVTYKWNVDGSDGEGFIAHELAQVCPDAVTGEKDAVDADGNPQYQGIDTSFLIATLTAAIQEQQAIIQTLTTRIAALEAK